MQLADLEEGCTYLSMYPAGTSQAGLSYDYSTAKG